MKSLLVLFLVLFVSGCILVSEKPTYEIQKHEALRMETSYLERTGPQNFDHEEAPKAIEPGMRTYSFSGYNNNKENSDSTSKSKWRPQLTKSEAIERAERLYGWIEDGPYDYWAARLVNHIDEYDVRFSDLSFSTEDLASKIWLNLWIESKEGG